MKFVDQLKIKVRGSMNLAKLKKDGLVVGKDFNAMDGVIIDPGHCWLIEIGDRVTLAPRVHILAHDASTKKSIGYTKIGCVTIGDDVFVGADTVILPGVNIENRTIIGAGSVVTKSITSGVWGGCPVHKLYEYDEYLEIQKAKMKKVPVYDETWTYDKITQEKKAKMKKELFQSGSGFVV